MWRQSPSKCLRGRLGLLQSLQSVVVHPGTAGARKPSPTQYFSPIHPETVRNVSDHERGTYYMGLQRLFQSLQQLCLFLSVEKLEGIRKMDIEDRRIGDEIISLLVIYNVSKSVNPQAHSTNTGISSAAVSIAAIAFSTVMAVKVLVTGD